jgi:hypothetical protein
MAIFLNCVSSSPRMFFLSLLENPYTKNALSPARYSMIDMYPLDLWTS